MLIHVTLGVEVDPKAWSAFNRVAQENVPGDLADFLAEVADQSKTFGETGASVITAVAR